MGTRGQIFIVDTGIYLYQHNDSYMLPYVVQRALARKEQWNNPEGLTKIIFNRMKDAEIGNKQQSDIDFLVILNVKTQIIEIKRMDGYLGKKERSDYFTFKEFVNNIFYTLEIMSETGD